MTDGHLSPRRPWQRRWRYRRPDGSDTATTISDYGNGCGTVAAAGACSLRSCDGGIGDAAAGCPADDIIIKILLLPLLLITMTMLLSTYY